MFDVNQLQKISKQVASSFKRKHPHLDLEELTSEAYLIALEATQTFDEKKGRQLYSWIGFMIHRNLNKKYSVYHEFLEYIDDISLSYKTNPERIYLAKEALNSVSIAAREAIKLVIVNHIVEKNKVKESLRDKGYAWNKIQKAFWELRRLTNAME